MPRQYAAEGIISRGPTLADYPIEADVTVTDGAAVLSLTGDVESVEDLDADVATYDAGALTRVADGIAGFLVHAEPRGSLHLKLAVTFSNDGVEYRNGFKGFLAGTLSKNCVDSLEGLLVEGKTTTVYSTLDHATPEYVRNTDFIGAALDLTCVAAWNSATGTMRKAGTLVSDRHILFANHYRIPDDATIRFVAADGTVVTKTLTEQTYVAYTDIAVGLLDSAVSGIITPATVVPANLSIHLLGVRYGIPLLMFDQEGKAFVYEWSQLSGVNTLQQPTREPWVDFSEAMADGDSGQPLFLVLDGEPVLLSLISTNNPWTVSQQLDNIEAAMNSFDGISGYELQTLVL